MTTLESGGQERRRWPRRGGARGPLPAAAGADGPVWDAMRLDLDDESVVVVPSVSLARTTAGSGSMMQAFEERFLFLLLLLRQPRLRMIYVTSMPIDPRIIEYYLALLPGVIPSHALARLYPGVGRRLLGAAAEREAAGAAEAAGEDRGTDPQSRAQPPHPLQHDRTGTRRRR